MDMVKLFETVAPYLLTTAVGAFVMWLFGGRQKTNSETRHTDAETGKQLLEIIADLTEKLLANHDLREFSEEQGREILRDEEQIRQNGVEKKDSLERLVGILREKTVIRQDYDLAIGRIKILEGEIAALKQQVAELKKIIIEMEKNVPTIPR